MMKLISKFNSTLIDNAEDLDIVVPMYNLLEYIQNYYYLALWSLWNYYRDEIDVNDHTSDGKSFKYKTNILGKTLERPERLPQPPQNPDETQPPWLPQPALPTLNAEVTIRLQYRGDFLIYQW